MSLKLAGPSSSAAHSALLMCCTEYAFFDGIARCLMKWLMKEDTSDRRVASSNVLTDLRIMFVSVARPWVA